MNFFGIEISDAKFEAGITAARQALRAWFDPDTEEKIDSALGFEAGDVAAPPAGVPSREL